MLCDGYDRYTEGCECCVPGITGIQLVLKYHLMGLACMQRTVNAV